MLFVIWSERRLIHLGIGGLEALDVFGGVLFVGRRDGVGALGVVSKSCLEVIREDSRGLDKRRCYALAWVLHLRSQRHPAGDGR